MSNPLKVKEVSSFGIFSGCKITVSKSAALGLSLPGAGDIGLDATLNIKIAGDHITYLGIK